MTYDEILLELHNIRLGATDEETAKRIVLLILNLEKNGIED